MSRIKSRFRVILALSASVAVVALASGTAAPLVTFARSTVAQFGFVPMRSGIPEGTTRFQLTSPDLANQQRFPLSEVANIFGCAGGNNAPRLEWSGAPANTKSFAVTMFDPDAPTGSGFWHWLTWNIPADATSLNADALPVTAVSGTNDAGLTGYLGPCPPAGDRTHRYQLTVYALNVSSLDLGPSTRGAVLGFSMRLDIIGFARMIATYSR